MDRVLPNSSRSIDNRRTSAAEIFTMFVNQTAEIPNQLNTMRKLIDYKELWLAQREIERRQYEGEQENRRAAREADREKRAAEENNLKTAENEQRKCQRLVNEEWKRH